MTRENAVQFIENEIKRSGFTPEINERFSPLPFVKGISELYIDVSIREHFDFKNSDIEKGIEAYSVEVHASVRKMGGNPDFNELLDAADQIKRGAELAKRLQDADIRYTVIQ